MKKKLNPGKVLKILGILLIVGGAVNIVLGALTFRAVLASPLLTAAPAKGTLLLVAAILALVGGVVEILAGITGLKNRSNPTKAGTCIALGVIAAVLSILGVVLTVIGSGTFATLNIPKLLLGFLWPVLFTVIWSKIRKIFAAKRAAMNAAENAKN